MVTISRNSLYRGSLNQGLSVLETLLLVVRHRRDLRRLHGVHDLLLLGSTKQDLFSVGKSKTENMTYKNKFVQLVERA